MSNLFNHTPVVTTTANQVELLAEEVQNAFNLLSNLLFIDNTYNASFTSSIGSLDTSYLKDYHPNDGKVIGYVQSLYFPVDSKEASLDLVPSTDIIDLTSITINNLSNPSEVYNYKLNGILLNDNDFTLVNKKVIFFSRPVDQLTITYNGYAYVDDSSDYNLRQNILTISNNRDLPVTYVSGFTYEITGSNFIDYLSDGIKYLINNNLDVLPYISIYSNNEKIELEEMEISNTLITFTTTEDTPANSITEANVYIANTTIGDLIKGLYKLIYNHNHSTTEGVNVNHKDLLGLFNNTSTIKYNVTNKENYDHPQYFNREGFIQDETVYNNSILGDIHLSSTDDSSYFNNLNESSNKIVFGSYNNGHKMYYDKDFNGLVIDANNAKNGLAVIAEINQVLLALNNNLITNVELLDESKYVEFMLEESKADSEGILKFTKRVVDPLDGSITSIDDAKIFVKTIEVGKLIINEELNITENAKLTFGDSYKIELDDLTGELNFDSETVSNSFKLNFKIPVDAVLIESQTIKSPNIVLDGSDSKLTFGTNEYITYDGIKLNFNTKESTNFRLNGYRKGISFDKKYWMYTSTPTGEELPENNLTNQNLYIETTSSGSVHFIKNTENIFTVGFNNLNELEKADTYSKNTYNNNYYVNYDDTQVNGLNLDLIDNNKIFAGKDTNGNLSTIIKTNSKVLIANTYTPSAIGTPVINYGELTANRLSTIGDKNTSSGYYGNVFIPTENKIVINGEAIFSSNITFTTNVKLENTLTAKDIIAESITVNDLDVKDTLTAKNLEVTDTGTTRLGSTNITKSLEVSQAITQNSSTANNVFNGSLKVVGKSEFLSGADFSNSLITGLINSAAPAADEGVSYALLQSEDSKLFERVINEVDTKLEQFVDTILERTFPMYTLYFNAIDDRNPAIIMGFGIWTRDMQGRSPIGIIKDTGLLEDDLIPDDAKQAQGWTFGEYAHSLTEEENGPHNHNYNVGDYPGGAGVAEIAGPTGEVKYTTLSSGEGVPHNTVHPVQIVSIWRRVG